VTRAIVGQGHALHEHLLDQFAVTDALFFADSSLRRDVILLATSTRSRTVSTKASRTPLSPFLVSDALLVLRAMASLAPARDQ
jgi:hypothetical protein